MIRFFLENLERIFGWLLQASWQASVLVALVLLIQWAFRTRLNSRWTHALWLLVIARLLLPALPESALSLFQFAPPPPPVIVQSVTEPIFASVVPAYANNLPAPSPVAPLYPFSVWTFLALIWLTGALGLLALTWQVNRRFGRHVRTAPQIDDPVLLQIAAAAQAELGLHRSLRLIESAHVQGPAIMGLVYPTLILPQNACVKFTDAELRFIFLHEFAHLKRGDLILQWLVAILQILHWFNPVLWYAFRRMRADRESATDALVLSRTGEAEQYGRVLIKLLEHYRARHALPTLVGILEDKDQFKRRFTLIGQFTLGAYGWSLLGVLLIGVLAIACLTKSKAANPVATIETIDKSDNQRADLIRISAKVVQIGEDDYQAHRSEVDDAVQKGDITPLSNLRSFNELADLASLTKSGERSVMERVRVMPYPVAWDPPEKVTTPDGSSKVIPATPTDFKRQELGERFVSTPTFAHAKIAIAGNLEVTSLQDWTQGKDHQDAVFHHRRISISDLWYPGQNKGFQVPGGAQMEPLDPTVALYSRDEVSDHSKNPKTLVRQFLFLNASVVPATANSATETEKHGVTDLHGHVIDPDGKPASSAKVGVGGIKTLIINSGLLDLRDDNNSGLIPSSPTGEFSLPAIPGGKTMVAIDRQGYALVPVQDFKGLIQLKPWARVEGQAFIGPKPAGKALVVLLRLPPSYVSGERVAIQASAIADEKGAFKIDRAPEGIVALTLSDGVPGHLPVVCRHAQAVGDQLTQVVLGGQGAVVTGKVSLPADGNIDSLNSIWTRPVRPDPAPKTVVSDQDKRDFMRALTSPQFIANERNKRGYYFYLNHDGSFRIENVPAGAYEISIWSRRVPKRKIIDASFDVPEGQTSYEIPSSLLSAGNSHVDASTTQETAAPGIDSTAQPSPTSNAIDPGVITGPRPAQQKLPWPVPSTVRAIGWPLTDFGEAFSPTDPAINATIDRLTIHELDVAKMPLQNFMSEIAKQLKKEHPEQPLWSTELMSVDAPFLITFHLQRPASVREILQQISASYPLRFCFRGAPDDLIAWQIGAFDRAFDQRAVETTIQLNLGPTDVKTALQAVHAAQGFAFNLRSVEKIGNKFGNTINAPIELPHGPITVDQALRRVLTAGNLRLIAQEGAVWVSPSIGGNPMKDADFAENPAGPVVHSPILPPSQVPNYELFLIDPRKTVKTIITEHMKSESVDVTLSGAQAAALLAFSQRNLGKHARVGLLRLSQDGKRGWIEPSSVNITAPIRDGVLHFDIPKSFPKDDTDRAVKYVA